MSTFSSTATLIVGAGMGAVAAFLIYLGVCVIAALRARTYGPLIVMSTHGRVILSFDAREDAKTFRRIARGLVGADGVVHYSFEPGNALEIAKDIRSSAHRLIETRDGITIGEDGQIKSDGSRKDHGGD